MAPAAASRADVARLFGRAAFGATPAELDTWTGRPYVEVVDALLPMPSGPDVVASLPRNLSGPVRHPGAAQSLATAQQWWLERMRTSSRRVEERLTLLWHDHFATGIEPPYPNVDMLLDQNHAIRALALGSFRDLLTTMTTDPAMLHWLNGAQSARPVPNENYAREFFELFALGKYPQTYTERDIREGARAFTGWTVNNNTRETAFDARRHDAGTKTILGSSVKDLGAGEHVEVARLALAQPVAPRFIAYKLVRGLAYDPGSEDLLRRPDALVAAVADVLARTGWDIRAAVRTLLLSDQFRANDGPHQRVRQPAEVVVAAHRALGLPANTAAATTAMSRLGQRLFDPPSVGGWPVGATWFSPGSTLARYELALSLFSTWMKQTPKPTPPPAADVARWTALLGLAGLHANTQSVLTSYLDSRRTAPEDERQAGVLALLLSSPDWMVL